MSCIMHPPWVACRSTPGVCHPNTWTARPITFPCFVSFSHPVPCRCPRPCPACSGPPPRPRSGARRGGPPGPEGGARVSRHRTRARVCPGRPAARPHQAAALMRLDLTCHAVLSHAWRMVWLAHQLPMTACVATALRGPGAVPKGPNNRPYNFMICHMHDLNLSSRLGH